MSAPSGFGMIAHRRASHGMRARAGSQRTRAWARGGGVRQRVSAATSARRVAARWSASSAPSDMPATATRAASARRRPRSCSTDAYQSRQPVLARSSMLVPWPASRTPRTGNPRAASASPSGRISSGVAVKPCTRRQPRARVPGSAKPSTTATDLAAGQLVAVYLERALLVRALLQVVEVRGHRRLALLLQERRPEPALRRLEARHVRRRAALERGDDRVARRGVHPGCERRLAREREGVGAKIGNGTELRNRGGATVEGAALVDGETAVRGRVREPDFLRPREELFAALLCRRLAPLATDVGEHARPHVRERRRVRLDPVEGDQHVDRLLRLDEIARLVLAQRERRLGEVLHAADAGDVGAGRERRRLLDRPSRDRLGERCPARELPPVGLRLLARALHAALVLERRDDLLPYRSERLGRGLAMLLHLDHVEAERRLDDVAHRAGRELERGVLEDRRHPAVREEAEVPTVRRRAGIVRVRARERGEVLAGLDAREQVGGLLPCRFARVGGGVGRELDEDVTGPDLLGLREALVLVQLVVLRDLAVRRLDLGRELGPPVGDVAGADRRRRAVVVGVRVEVALQLLVRGRHLRAELRGRDADERERRLLVVEPVALLDFRVAHLDAVGHQRLDALEKQALPHLGLELALVALAAEKGLQPVAVEAAAVLELRETHDGGVHVGVADADAEPRRLVAEERLVDELVERATADVERARELRGPLTLQHLLVSTLQHCACPVEIVPRDGRALDPGDDVHALGPARADPPDDEESREDTVEDLDAGRAGVLAEKPEHSRACARG